MFSLGIDPSITRTKGPSSSRVAAKNGSRKSLPVSYASTLLCRRTLGIPGMNQRTTSSMLGCCAAVIDTVSPSQLMPSEIQRMCTSIGVTSLQRTCAAWRASQSTACQGSRQAYSRGRMMNLRALAAYTRRTVRSREGCELCGATIGDRHPHVVALHDASIQCACTACAVLFRDGTGRWRTVPDRVLIDRAFSPAEGEWAALEIPVGLAYVVRQSALGTRLAFYPSPAGPTNAPVSDEAWERLAAHTSLAARVENDVEALLLNRRRGRAAEIFLAPIDACLELVGL